MKIFTVAFPELSGEKASLLKQDSSSSPKLILRTNFSCYIIISIL